jgi:hypothetical protein
LDKPEGSSLQRGKKPGTMSGDEYRDRPESLCEEKPRAFPFLNIFDRSSKIIPCKYGNNH